MFTRLLGLQYRIIYKKGMDNDVADALSRQSILSSSYLAISLGIPQWISEVALFYVQDSDARAMIAKLMLDSSAVPHFS
jgi:hypothetical protein